MALLAAPHPARGHVAEGYLPVAKLFAEQLARGEEVGAAFAVEKNGEREVDLYGGLADVERNQPWQADTRLVVFSVTKGFAAMALHLLADRGVFSWDEPVASYWPGFAQGGKSRVTVRCLVNHRAGLAALDQKLQLEDCLDDARWPIVVEALESQRPLWQPGEGQAYHAVTFGLYVKELFHRLSGVSIGEFLRRELFEPVESDALLGTPASEDERVATLYPPENSTRLKQLVKTLILTPNSNEARVGRAFLGRKSLVRAAFGNPAMGARGLMAYNEVPVRRAELPWASATASARGVARAYSVFASGGTYAGRRLLKERIIAPVHARQGWSQRDGVLHKALGWSQGFLKEEQGVFGPAPEAFGHSGLGGALGWCDPVAQLSLGYVMNKLDWRVRSPRAMALVNALYQCEPVRRS